MDVSYKQQLTLEIAKSDLRSGVPERATTLLTEAVDDPGVITKLRTDIARFEGRYGAPLITHQKVWAGIPGDVRGQSLVAYFETRRDQLRGMRVLHVAPESALRAWLARELPALGGKYVTLDPFSEDVDLTQDLTDLRLDDGSFDLVVCHRVLEHVLDDRAALREVHRVLCAGGTLNFSVPQTPSLDVTNDWIIPDTSHDGHVRQYGDDLDDRLRESGFASVAVDTFLLERTLEAHVAAGTYPLRMYVCRKARA
jgi:SAM-dependent methyltransferase